MNPIFTSPSVNCLFSTAYENLVVLGTTPMCAPWCTRTQARIIIAYSPSSIAHHLLPIVHPPLSVAHAQSAAPFLVSLVYCLLHIAHDAPWRPHPISPLVSKLQCSTPAFQRLSRVYSSARQLLRGSQLGIQVKRSMHRSCQAFSESASCPPARQFHLCQAGRRCANLPIAFPCVYTTGPNNQARRPYETPSL